MNIREMYPSKWITPDDIMDRRFQLKIQYVQVVEVYDERNRTQVRKFAVTFFGAQKRLLLNKTQTFAIASIVKSEETDEWRGHKVVLRRGYAHNGKATIVVEAPVQSKPSPELNENAHNGHYDGEDHDDSDGEYDEDHEFCDIPE